MILGAIDNRHWVPAAGRPDPHLSGIPCSPPVQTRVMKAIGLSICCGWRILASPQATFSFSGWKPSGCGCEQANGRAPAL